MEGKYAPTNANANENGMLLDTLWSVFGSTYAVMYLTALPVLVVHWRTWWTYVYHAGIVLAVIIAVLVGASHLISPESAAAPVVVLGYHAFVRFTWMHHLYAWLAPPVSNMYVAFSFWVPHAAES